MNTSAHANIRRNGEGGFAMLFSVLVSSVLLAIGLSIFNLTIKEIELSSSGRESQFSFYAADTGAECALYWDFSGTNVFATSTASVSNRNPSPANPDCVDAIGTPQTFDASASVISSNVTSATTRFSLSVPNTLPSGAAAPYCATVTVTKTDSGGIITTVIDSRGYNTCDTTDPMRVERALKVTY